MNAEFYTALDLLQAEKGLSKEVLLEKIKAALIAAVRRDKQIPAENIDVVFDEDKKTIRVFIKKTVSDPVNYPSVEISIEDAKALDSKAEVGDIVEIDVNPADVGRIAAQVGKNVITQSIVEAVNKTLVQEFEELKGTLVSGVVSRVDQKNHSIFIELKGYEMQMSEKDLIPGEKFKDGDRIKVCVSDIKKTAKNQEIILSRSNTEFLRCLFETEVPEIADKIVEIKAVSREAGSRSKVAVSSTDPNVDPVGSCIGAKQARINAVLSNLGGERIDLINYSENPEEFVVASLSPATVRMLEINTELKTCKVVVPADQLSLAIGKTGQNVRLAARLTGYKIDIIAE